MKLTKNKIKEIEKAFLSAKNGTQLEDKIPDGYFTKWEYVAETNLGRSTAERQIYMLVKQDKLEVRSFKVKSRTGIKTIPHYRVK